MYHRVDIVIQYIKINRLDTFTRRYNATCTKTVEVVLDDITRILNNCKCTLIRNNRDRRYDTIRGGTICLQNVFFNSRVLDSRFV